MAYTAKGAIFARVTTKTIFMKFKKLRIIQAGLTTNFGVHEGGKYPLSITDAAVKSVVALGNLRPVHCRRTHNGSDMLDGYLGKFTNFVYENGAAFADFEMSEALETAYPNEAKFIATMIEKEPDMLGVSVVGYNSVELNDGILDVTEFVELYSCDLVGLPAATESLFNNNKTEKKMNKFFSPFANLFQKTQFATETVKTVDGSSITIEAAGEVMAIGDKVFDSEGNVHPDGEVQIQVEEGILIITIEGGVITGVRPYEAEEPETAAVPEEFYNRISALETSIATLTASVTAIAAQFNRATAKPGVPPVNIPKDKRKETALTRDAVSEAAKRFYKK